MLGYGNEKGEERLRIAIGEMLRLERGLSIDTENICVTRGSQMALYLVACTLIKHGDVVAVENPGYEPVWKAFTHAGATLQPVKVDEQGICAVTLEKLCKRKKIKAIYVTPHHQFPTTVNMKADRRIKLIELSNKYGFAIVEDDYDHDYHFCLRNVLPIASSERAPNVIYISSLTKLIAPAVRIGYVAGPKNFIDSLAAFRRVIDRQGDVVMELAVAELMEEGEIRKHARRAFSVYKERRDLMAKYLDTYLSKHASFVKPDGGLAYWVKFNKTIHTGELASKLLKKGVAINPTERFSFDGKPLSALRLGYAALDVNELENGIKLLSMAL
jgi:GntR family transcriptional regulator/MocR family aminotransferase